MKYANRKLLIAAFSFLLMGQTLWAVPTVFCLQGDNVCAGEEISLQVKSRVANASYQWYYNSTPIVGATEPVCLFTLPAAAGGHTFRVEENGVTSNILSLTATVCCSNNNGDPIPRRVIFKDDFGEFDYKTDPSGKTYKVWDYSDPLNPKLVTKTTPYGFRYELDVPPFGLTFSSYERGNPQVWDNEYTVAGVLTRSPTALPGIRGAALDWSASIGGKSSVIDPEYDASGKLEGCCLLINFPANKAGEVLYERTLNNLCPGREHFFECYITVFSNGPDGGYRPVNMQIRLTEVGNPANSVIQGATATREADGGTGWQKVSNSITLTTGSQIKMEIINNENSSVGNDLVLDDITVRVCGVPTLDADLDNSTTTSCLGDDVVIKANPSPVLQTYFPGGAYYLYQYSNTPDDKTSWRNLDDVPTTSTSYADLSAVFATLANNEKIYCRVIAGEQAALTTTAAADFNENEPCANYTVSGRIELEKYCEDVCEEPLNIIINSSKTPATTFPMKEINMSSAETVTLSTNDIAPLNAYADYTIKWFKGDKFTSVGIVASPAVMAAPLSVSGTDIDPVNGTMYYVQVYDRNVPDPACMKWDSIMVRVACAAPDDIIIRASKNYATVNGVKEVEVCDNGLVVLSTNNIATFGYTNYTITWYKGDTTTIVGMPVLSDATAEPLAVLGSEIPAGGVMYYVQAYDAAMPADVSCHSWDSIRVVAAPSPTGAIALLQPFYEGSLLSEPSKNVSYFDVLWYTAEDTLIQVTEPYVSDNEAQPLPYEYYYVVQEPLTGCRSEVHLYSVMVMEVPIPDLVIPKQFAPNGLNKTWEIENLREYYPDAKVIIHDRFGKVVAEYTGADEGWDGISEGKPASSTDYWYLIEIPEGNKQIVGHFTLIRR